MTDPTYARPDEITFAEARIINVNSNDFTVQIVTDGPNALTASDIPWPVPWRHPDGGGIDFMPEVGATCYTVWHPWDDLPWILGFSSQYHREAVWGSGRRDMKPGDAIMWTRDDNRIVARRGGNIEVVSSKECKRYYIFARHAIEECCRQWSMTTRGGELKWTTDDNKLAAATGARSKLRIAAKKFAQDGDPVVVLEMGGRDPLDKVGTSDVVFSMTIKDKYFFSVAEDGSVAEFSDKDWATVVKGDHSLTVVGSHTVKAAGNVDIRSTKGSLKLFARTTHSLEAASSKETINTIKHISANQILLGKSPQEPAVLGLQLLQWLAAHTHPPTGGPPIQAPTLPLVLSKKVRVE